MKKTTSYFLHIDYTSINNVLTPLAIGVYSLNTREPIFYYLENTDVGVEMLSKKLKYSAPISYGASLNKIKESLKNIFSEQFSICEQIKIFTFNDSHQWGILIDLLGGYDNLPKNFPNSDINLSTLMNVFNVDKEIINEAIKKSGDMLTSFYGRHKKISTNDDSVILEVVASHTAIGKALHLAYIADKLFRL